MAPAVSLAAAAALLSSAAPVLDFGIVDTHARRAISRRLLFFSTCYTLLVHMHVCVAVFTMLQKCHCIPNYLLAHARTHALLVGEGVDIHAIEMRPPRARIRACFSQICLVSDLLCDVAGSHDDDYKWDKRESRKHAPRLPLSPRTAWALHGHVSLIPNLHSGARSLCVWAHTLHVVTS
jgi:hypothetical protein